MADADPLILTLDLGPPLFELAKTLRDTHFPPALNRVPPHVTLFHDLPGREIASVAAVLKHTTSANPPLPVTFDGVRFLGKGVALTVRSSGLMTVRAHLASLWADWLTPQDRQRFAPHLTVQNKVAADRARVLSETLKNTWEPVDGHAPGLLLWHYRGGPWEPASSFEFGASVLEPR